MPRVKRGPKRRRARKKALKRASGYFLTKSKLHQAAVEAVEKALRYAYVGRRQRKRDFRSLWIVRIGAAARQCGLSYSRFMNGLKKAGVELNRKMLAETAVNDMPAFQALAEKAKAALAGAQ
ncbi:MAG: 50S ribosomal protein L20 [Bryobacterales bacterium]|nr:50S ribosomal protein L20 [Bryobacteraceae bacterium]MDW8353914.1 50S ribosomal protein L20 [Bryobacterales bacterium]